MENYYIKRPCDKCLKPVESRLLNAYGALLCEDCWDDYLFTDEGKVEYIIGITRGDYPMEYFDADFLGLCATQWNKIRTSLILLMTRLLVSKIWQNAQVYFKNNVIICKLH